MGFSSNILAFNKELEDFAKQSTADFLLLHKRVVLEAISRLVLKTPVDTGQARGGWQGTIGAPAPGGTGDSDKGGQRTIANVEAVLSELAPFGVFWITNNVDHIEFLENGTSQQAPAGMLAVTVEELRAIFS